MEPDGGRKDNLVHDVDSPIERVVSRSSKTLRVKDFSRLWQYRNGRSPPRSANEDIVEEEKQQ